MRLKQEVTKLEVEDKVAEVDAKTAKTTWTNIIKHSVDVKTDEENQVGSRQDEAERRVQASHQHVGQHSQDQDPQHVLKVSLTGTGLRSSPWKARRWKRRPHRPQEHPHRSSRSSTIGGRTLTTTILYTRIIIIIKNKHAESKKISVKV